MSLYFNMQFVSVVDGDLVDHVPYGGNPLIHTLVSMGLHGVGGFLMKLKGQTID